MFFRYVLILITVVNSVNGQVYFSNAHLTIHSRKNISSIYLNEKNLKLVISNLGLLKKFFKGKAENSTSNFTPNILLQKQTENCISNLKNDKDQAMKIIGKAFTKEHNIVERGIPILGEIIAKLTDQPSPSQWDHETKIISKLEKVVKGELEQEHQIDQTLKHENQAIIEINNELRSIYEKDKEFRARSFTYFFNMNKIDNICNHGTKIAKILLYEAKEIQEIKEKSRLNLPSENLFPINDVFKKINNLKNEENSPIFKNLHQTEQIYAMTSAVTVVNLGIIHSIMTIPLVDFTYKYTFIPYPILPKNDLETLQTIKRITQKQTNIMLCSEALNTLKIISSSDLRRCTNTPTKKLYICKGRQIKQHNYSESCKRLPKDIVIELEENLIFIKTTEKNFQLECDKLTHEIILNSTYNVVKIEPTCKLIGKDLVVGNYEKEKRADYQSKPFEITSYEMKTPNLNEFEAKNQNKKDNFPEINKTIIEKDVEKLDLIDKENRNRLEGLEKTIKEHVTMNWSVTGGVIALASIGLFVCFLCKRKNSSSKTDN